LTICVSAEATLLNPPVISGFASIPEDTGIQERYVSTAG
jgi:hypothetical protein